MSINLNNLNNINIDLEKYQQSCLMIVSKNRSIEDINHLIKLGYNIFGENRVQEAKKKFSLKNPNIELHLIGPLQTNKVKDALNIFDVIQCVDRKKLIDFIHGFMKQEIKTKSFFIQVNIGNEKQKSGVPISDLPIIYDYAKKKNLNIKGLMCIPPVCPDPKIYFEKMIEIKNQINPNLLLSMGMSNDYKIALECGSNFIRVGSLIFK